MKNLLKLMDLSEKEIVEILNTADQLKFEKKNGIPHRLLEGKVLGLIFAKSSTRTRVSFEVGMFDLSAPSPSSTGSRTIATPARCSPTS